MKNYYALFPLTTLLLVFGSTKTIVVHAQQEKMCRCEYEYEYLYNNDGGQRRNIMTNDNNDYDRNHRNLFGKFIKDAILSASLKHSNLITRNDGYYYESDTGIYVLPRTDPACSQDNNNYGGGIFGTGGNIFGGGNRQLHTSQHKHLHLRGQQQQENDDEDLDLEMTTPRTLTYDYYRNYGSSSKSYKKRKQHYHYAFPCPQNQPKPPPPVVPLQPCDLCNGLIVGDSSGVITGIVNQPIECSAGNVMLTAGQCMQAQQAALSTCICQQPILPSCNVCGDGKMEIGNPDAIIVAEGFSGEVQTCSKVQGQALSTELCEAYQAAAFPCECYEKIEPVCYVCGPDLVLGNTTDGQLEIDSELYTCQQAQELGDEGQISVETCLDLQNQAIDNGGCPCQEPVYPKCDICNGLQIGDPEQHILFGNNWGSCRQAQDMGEKGLLDEEECSKAKKAAADNCVCQEEIIPVVTDPPISKPCDICKGMTIGKATGLVEVNGKQVTCVEALALGKNGQISEDSCPVVQSKADTACLCEGEYCDICNGLDIGDPEGILSLGDCEEMTCQVAQDLGDLNRFSPESCSALQAQAPAACACQEPIIPTNDCIEDGFCNEDCPESDPDPDCTCFCDICDGMTVANATGLIEINSQLVTCAEAVAMGEAGEISKTMCTVAQINAMEACSCQGTVIFFCDICDGLEIGDPLEEITVDSETMTCQAAQDLGDQAGITPVSCLAVQDQAQASCACQQQIVENCELNDICNENCPEDNPDPDCTFTCDICEGLIVGNATGLIEVNGEEITCAEAFSLGESSEIPASVCSTIQGIALNACSCQAVIQAPCDICDGLVIGEPEGLVTVNGDSMTCQEAQALGEQLLITPVSCFYIQQAAPVSCACQEPNCDLDDICNEDCTDDNPDPDCTFTCDICDGMIVGNATGLIEVYGQQITCADAVAIGEAGQIPASVCAILQDAALTACTCQGIVVATCDICNGLEIGDPDGEITVDGDSMTCQEAQSLGDQSMITPVSCLAVQEAAPASCACQEPIIPTPECDICNGMTVGNVTALIEVNGQLMTCGYAMQLGETGQIPEDSCPTFQDVASTACECQFVLPFFCDICDGLVIGDPEGIVTVDGREMSCEDAQGLGDDALICPSSCTDVQALAPSACACQQPIIPDCTENGICNENCPESNPDPDCEFTCDICNGLTLTNATATIEVDGTQVTCGEAMLMGQNGQISKDSCPVVQENAAISCECICEVPFTCDICDGLEMGDLEGVLDIEGELTTCEQAQLLGDQSKISPETCSVLQGQSPAICACQEPIIPSEDCSQDGFCNTNCQLTNTPDPDCTFTCDICDGLNVGNIDGFVTVNGQQVRCVDALAMGMIGMITEESCSAVQQEALDACSCQGVVIHICDICDGLEIGEPTGTIIVDSESMSCQAAQELGASAKISPASCLDVQNQALASCACQEPIIPSEDCTTDGVCNENCPITSPDPDCQCSICKDLYVGNETGLISVDGQQMTCGHAMYLGETGQIPVASCSQYQDAAVSACDCQFELPFFCDVCNGLEMGDPDGIINVEGQEMTCAEAQILGEDAQICPPSCFDVQSQAASACACQQPIIPECAMDGICNEDCPDTSPDPDCNFQCDICKDLTMGNTEGLIAVDGVQVTCHEAMVLGETGQISEEICSNIQAEALKACDCVCLLPFNCDICDGLVIGDPEGSVLVDGTVMTCQEAQALGDVAKISPTTCPFVQDQAPAACACQQAIIPKDDCIADNICNENCSDLNPDPDCVVEPTSDRSKCTVSSKFDAGSEGWTIIGDARTNALWNATGGNPGGFIWVEDLVLGGTWYFQAPNKFRGNFSGAYGRSLSFDLGQILLDSQHVVDSDVRIERGSSTISLALPVYPGIQWTGYSFLVEPSSTLWKRSDGNNAEEADIRFVLENITNIFIRGEYRVGKDTGYMDNVILESDCDESL